MNAQEKFNELYTIKSLQFNPNISGHFISIFNILVYQQAHKVGITEPYLDAKYVKR